MIIFDWFLGLVIFYGEIFSISYVNILEENLLECFKFVKKLRCIYELIIMF